MRKCIFILPYFGKFGDYFNLFLRSCEKNAEYDWLILTDDKARYNYPGNVHVIYTTFEEVKAKLMDRIGMKISLPSPYKLCDFKPTYGLVFEDYIANYEYWGHCDCDVMFGDLSALLTPLLCKEYDKLFAAGHLTVYKNNRTNNRRFLGDYDGRQLAKEFLTIPAICWFDEDWKKDNIHKMFLRDGVKVFSDVLALNPSGKHTFFVQRKYIPEEHRYEEEKYSPALYVWNDGRILRQTVQDNQLQTEEFLYIHLQHRRMKVIGVSDTDKIIQIVPNKFVPMHRMPETVKEWRKVNKEPLTAYAYTISRQFTRIKRKIGVTHRR